MKTMLCANHTKNYTTFEKGLTDVLDRHAPIKKEVVRSNHEPYMTKVVRKAIMKRTSLENKYWKDKSIETKEKHIVR